MAGKKEILERLRDVAESIGEAVYGGGGYEHALLNIADEIDALWEE